MAKFGNRPRARGRARARFSGLPHLEKSPISPQTSLFDWSNGEILDLEDEHEHEHEHEFS